MPARLSDHILFGLTYTLPMLEKTLRQVPRHRRPKDVAVCNFDRREANTAEQLPRLSIQSDRLKKPFFSMLDHFYARIAHDDRRKIGHRRPILLWVAKG
jgi:hypothetical protein